MALELTAVNESILLDNINIFKKNGFDFQINEEGNCGYSLLLCIQHSVWIDTLHTTFLTILRSLRAVLLLTRVNVLGSI